MAQTVYLSPITLIVQYLTNLGVMAEGGTLTVYLAGATTLATTYTDSTGTATNPNPMTLNQAGRPALPGGAPTAFWSLPGVVLKLSVVDAQGNQLVGPLDNLAAIGDLTNNTNVLQTLLANPASSNLSGTGPVAGADLVANAMKSYDTFADLRAANIPSLASGQTLTVDVQGGTVVGDNNGGTFYWSASATATDNGLTVIKPNGVASVNPGRYLRRTEPYPQIFGGAVPIPGNFPIGVPIYYVQAADQSVTNSTVLVNSTNLQQFLNPPASGGNAVYLVSARLQFLGVGGTTQGYSVEIAFNGTQANSAGGPGFWSSNTAMSSAYEQINTPLSPNPISSTLGDFANFDFIVAVSGGGTLSVKFAQQASSANATVLKAGSTLIITRVA